MAAVDAEAFLAEQMVWWEADSDTGRRLLIQVREILPELRQNIIELIAITRSGPMKEEAIQRLGEHRSAALPLILFASRPQLSPHLGALLGKQIDGWGAPLREDAMAAMYSLLEHPASLTSESIELAVSLIVRLCGFRGEGSQSSEVTEAEERRFAALLDSSVPAVRACVARALAASISYTLICPNPAYEAHPSPADLDRYEWLFEALASRADDAVILPAYAEAARTNGDGRARLLLERTVEHGPDEVRAAAVGALAEIGAPQHAQRALDQDSPAVRVAALRALPTSAVRQVLKDRTKLLASRLDALADLAERRDIQGRWEFGQSALERVARDVSLELELRRAAFARLVADRVPHGDPLRDELGDG